MATMLRWLPMPNNRNDDPQAACARVFDETSVHMVEAIRALIALHAARAPGVKVSLIAMAVLHGVANALAYTLCNISEGEEGVKTMLVETGRLAAIYLDSKERGTDEDTGTTN